MTRRIHLAILGSLIGASVLGAQESVPHRACRDAHPAPVCGSYFLFEFNAASRIAGTTVTPPFASGPIQIREPALASWFAWDLGWMRNPRRTLGLGGAFEVGGNEDGMRLALRAKARRWLAHDVVVDASAGPLMAQFQTGDGEKPTYGMTGDVGVGRARLLLVTVGADMARQNGSMQYAAHVGGRAESASVVVISALAAIGGLIVVSALGGADY